MNCKNQKNTKAQKTMKNVVVFKAQSFRKSKILVP